MITCREIGSGTNTTNDADQTITPTDNSATGKLLIMYVAYENANISGGDTYISIRDSYGNAWTEIFSVVNSSGTINDGTVMRSFSTMQDQNGLTTSDSILLSFSTTIEALVHIIYEVDSTNILTITDSSSTSGTGSSPTITTNTIDNNNIVICAFGRNSSGTITDDADTSNGSWSAGISKTKVATYLTQELHSQYKVVTASATQTYNPTIDTRIDSIYNLGWVEIHEDSSVTSSPILIMWNMTSY